VDGGMYRPLISVSWPVHTANPANRLIFGDPSSRCMTWVIKEALTAQGAQEVSITQLYTHKANDTVHLLLNQDINALLCG
jgi:hypothetical protein